MKITTNSVILIIILIILGVLYKSAEQKRIRESDQHDMNSIQRYLLNAHDDLGNSSKPILWIHIPYEYNARKWASWGSRSSKDLNQPYLYLCLKSIISKCDENFTICIIDDNSFEKLIPGWTIDMSTISDPILEKMRVLGEIQLLKIYGGLICPVSFICFKDLIEMYEKGTLGNKMFMCQFNNDNITSTTYNYYPSLKFCGAKKETQVVEELVDFIQRTISTDYTAQSVFQGDFDRWCSSKAREGKINVISGMEIGIKTRDDRPINIDTLMSQNVVNLHPQAFGIYIPAQEILNRRNYEWFAYLSEEEVLKIDSVIGRYLLLSNSPEKAILKTKTKVKPSWVSFWKIPSKAPLWGVKPNMLGDNLTQLSHPLI